MGTTPSDPDDTHAIGVAAGAFAELLLRHRLTAGLSQREVAARSGLSERAVRDLERGSVARPRRRSVLAVATALGVTGDELAVFLAAARAGATAAPPAVGPQPDPGGLVGRGVELRALADLVTGGRHRLVTVTGPSGVGKSRLVAELVTVLRQRTALDVRTLDLSAVREPELVGELVAEALGCGGASRLAPAARVAAGLRGRRVLLVLDCFERLLPAATVVAELIARCPGLAVVVTSQRPLRLATERLLPLPPLPQDATVELFALRAAQVAPGFTVTPENRASVAAVCGRLEGLPLAVELAAARIRLMTPTELADRLDERLRMLTGGGPDRPVRHRSLRAAIEAGLDAVTAPARALFTWLGAVRAGALLADLEAVAATLGHDGDWLLAALTELVDTSLVRVAARAGASRYTLPDAMAELAAQRLAAGPDEHRLRGAVAARYLARVADWHAGRGPALDDGDAGNLRAAVTWAAAYDIALVDRVVAEALPAYYEQSGRYVEGVAALLRVGAAGQVTGWLGASRLANLRGDLDESARYAATALARCDPDDHARRATALLRLGTVSSERRDVARARTQLRAALVAARRAGDLRLVARVLNNLGVASAAVGRLRDAERELRAALEARRRGGAGALEQGRSLHNLAELARDMDRSELAAARAAEAAELFSAGGDNRAAATAASTGALELVRLGRSEDALAAARRASALLGDPGDDRRTAVVVDLRWSVVLHAAGQAAAAADILGQTLRPALDHDHRTQEELALTLVAQADLLTRGRSGAAGRRHATAAAGHLLGAATALLCRTNRPVPPSAAGRLARAADACRAGVGVSEYERAHRDGARLDPGALVDTVVTALAGAGR